LYELDKHIKVTNVKSRIVNLTSCAQQQPVT